MSSMQNTCLNPRSIIVRSNYLTQVIYDSFFLVNIRANTRPLIKVNIFRVNDPGVSSAVTSIKQLRREFFYMGSIIKVLNAIMNVVL